MSSKYCLLLSLAVIIFIISEIHLTFFAEDVGYFKTPAESAVQVKALKLGKERILTSTFSGLPSPQCFGRDTRIDFEAKKSLMCLTSKDGESQPLRVVKCEAKDASQKFSVFTFKYENSTSFAIGRRTLFTFNCIKAAPFKKAPELASLYWDECLQPRSKYRRTWNRLEASIDARPSFCLQSLKSLELSVVVLEHDTLAMVLLKLELPSLEKITLERIVCQSDSCKIDSNDARQMEGKEFEKCVWNAQQALH
ncbi:hypothetical protein TYRP_016864 [Tyrophagus putrescentiae]|nr:hypothetical protein TYRP_016864 [Tyrophagus putrescentiae]